MPPALHGTKSESRRGARARFICRAREARARESIGGAVPAARAAASDPLREEGQVTGPVTTAAEGREAPLEPPVSPTIASDPKSAFSFIAEPPSDGAVKEPSSHRSGLVATPPCRWWWVTHKEAIREGWQQAHEYNLSTMLDDRTRHGKTAGELIRELEADPKWRASMAERDRARSLQVQANLAELAPLHAELRRYGIDVAALVMFQAHPAYEEVSRS